MPKRELSEAKHVVLDRALALDPTLQPRRGAPLGHKRAEQQVPRKGTLNTQPTGLAAFFSVHILDNIVCNLYFCRNKHP
jgi:hypothetical protein